MSVTDEPVPTPTRTFVHAPSQRVHDATTARPCLWVPAVRIQTDVQTSRRRVAARVLIRRNSGGTIIRCSRSHANHSVALNYSELRVLFMTAFSHATGKFARAGFAGRNRAARAFHKGRTAFISHRPGRLWDAGFTFSRRALSFIYSQHRVGSCRFWVFFFQCAKHLTCCPGNYRPDLCTIKLQ